MAAYHGGGSYQDPDEAREWALDRAHDPEWRPPVEDDGQQVSPTRPCWRCFGRGSIQGSILRCHACNGSGRVPADPMVVVGLVREAVAAYDAEDGDR